MDWLSRIRAFYEKAGSDLRIGPVHIALYFSLVHSAIDSGFELIIPVREVLMMRAKISSTVTYNRILHELHAYGYIDYRPSFAPGRTRVVMIELCSLPGT